MKWQQTVKYLAIAAVVLYVFSMVVTHAGSIGNLLKNAANLAKAFGAAWVLWALLSLVLPILAGTIRSLFNRGAKFKTQQDNFERAQKNVSEETGRELNAKELERLREIMNEKEVLDSENAVEKPAFEEAVGEAAGEFGEGEAGIGGGVE